VPCRFEGEERLAPILIFSSAPIWFQVSNGSPSHAIRSLRIPSTAFKPLLLALPVLLLCTRELEAL
jgi:hypothetical protein